MEFNTFNTFDIVGNESCQPNYLISMTLEDSHIMRLEGDFLESSDQTSSSEEKKYKTLSPEQREDIVKGLKSEGIIGSELTLPQQGMWRKFVSCLENKQKNEKNAAKELKIESEIWKTMLRNVIPRFVPEFDPSDSKEMASMWRKVKRMLGSHGKSEKRGDPSILDNEFQEFKEGLIKIISKLSSKCFEALREEALLLVNDIRKSNGREEKDDAFSKHYWFDLLAEHSDIKKLWEVLPRSNAKGKIPKLEVALSQSTSASSASSSNTFMESQAVEGFDNSVDEFGCVKFLSDESLFSGEGYRSAFGGLEQIPNFESSLIQPDLFSFEDEEYFNEGSGTPRFGNPPCRQSEEDFAGFRKSFVKTHFAELEDETQSNSKENYPMSFFEGSLTKALFDDKVFGNNNIHGKKHPFKKQVSGGFTNGFSSWRNMRNDDGNIELEDSLDPNCYQKPVFAGLSNGFYL